MLAAICILLTLYSFVELMPTDDDQLLFWKSKNGPPCEPFTMFMINCNKCVCSADGTPSCTKMDCDRIKQTTDSTYESD
ncbi:uncharacterized protein isoform X2 [Choristoneura fumiferana]|uniref:uncharacterized protein isoform X2 n=1 Tax=Choristoneura fumiferana TaxID=7141 RepID=UPI003D1581D4